MLLSPIRVSGKELLKHSFLDLVFRGILRVYQAWHPSHPRDPHERLYTLVSRGKRYDAYVPSPHQDLFVEPFAKEDHAYQVRILLRNVYLDGKASGFKRRVYATLRQKRCFSASWGLKWLNLFFLNERGATAQKEFEKLLNLAEKKLPEYVKTDPEKARELITTLGSNVLLLDNFRDELLEKLPLVLRWPEHERERSTYDFDDFELDFPEMLTDFFLDTIGHFDTSFDSFDAALDLGNIDTGGGFSGDMGGDFMGGDW